jgi:putative peptidoglycan lipid II flippase
MSQDAAQLIPPTGLTEAAKPDKTFVHHARLISGLTLVSRFLGVLRESLAARYFGAGLVSTAFTVAFTIPNLFRRLFGEGALSAAFIPLYSQAMKRQEKEDAARFAAASVNLLVAILVGVTIVGELILWGIAGFWHLQADRLLTVKLTAIMLPYVLLVCGAAFLGAILQVHRRFGLIAAAPIVLNAGLIGSTVLGAKIWDMKTTAGQTAAIYFVSCGVLVAGALQVAMLLPSLRAIGFRFRWTSLWTPAVKRMLIMSVPVAIGAGVLQLSVAIDRGISYLLAQSLDQHDQLITHFSFFGHWVRYPMELGAAPRLYWAQLLYQFPLGVFAIAVATAIFPTLSADALDNNRERFRQSLRRGIKLTLWEGLPASVGLIMVAQPAVQLLFEYGRFKGSDTTWVASSVQLYSIAIWAFSLQQILNRAYYALHDMTTPLVMAVVTLIVNLIVEVPLVWTGLGEAGMAAGTSASFIVQAVLMLWLLQRKAGSLDLGQLRGFCVKLVIATALMAAACWMVQKTPFYPDDGNHTRMAALLRLVILMGTGAIVYLGACLMMGIGSLEHLRPRKAKAAANGSLTTGN